MKKWDAKRGHSLCPARCFFTVFNAFIYHLISNISKTVLGSGDIWFCREFQALSSSNKIIYWRWQEKIVLKIRWN